VITCRSESRRRLTFCTDFRPVDFAVKRIHLHPGRHFFPRISPPLLFSPDKRPGARARARVSLCARVCVCNTHARVRRPSQSSPVFSLPNNDNNNNNSVSSGVRNPFFSAPTVSRPPAPPPLPSPPLPFCLSSLFPETSIVRRFVHLGPKRSAIVFCKCSLNDRRILAG